MLQGSFQEGEIVRFCPDEAYAEYRPAKNPQMFGLANWSTRTMWDKTFAGDLVPKDVEEAHWKFLKWQCVLSALKQPLAKPITVKRGLCGLPDFLVAQFKSKQKGDKIFWASLSSTTRDPKIADDYANQAQPVSRNVLFTIEGVDEGLELKHLSQYPKEQEFLLPLCSMLEVIDVSVGPPVVLRCQYLGTLLSSSFLHDCMVDLIGAWTDLLNSVAVPV